MDLRKLVSDAQLDFGFASGTGLGAVLLAIVLIVLFVRTKLTNGALSALVSAFRRNK